MGNAATRVENRGLQGRAEASRPNRRQPRAIMTDTVAWSPFRRCFSSLTVSNAMYGSQMQADWVCRIRLPVGSASRRCASDGVTRPSSTDDMNLFGSSHASLWSLGDAETQRLMVTSNAVTAKRSCWSRRSVLKMALSSFLLGRPARKSRTSPTVTLSPKSSAMARCRPDR